MDLWITNCHKMNSRHRRAESVSVRLIGRRMSSAFSSCCLNFRSRSSCVIWAREVSCSCRVCKLMFPSIPRILAMQSFQISQQNRMEFLMKDIVISSPSSTLLKTISSTTCWSSRGNIVRFAVITSFPPFKAEKLIIFRRLFGNSLCLDARAGAVLQTSDHCCSRLCLPHLLSAIQPWKYPGRFISRRTFHFCSTPSLSNRSYSRKILSWGRRAVVRSIIIYIYIFIKYKYI